MPFYDLRCPKCGKEYNISATIAEKTEKRIPCPDCGSFELETVFKGSPAYIKSREGGACPNRHICGSGAAMDEAAEFTKEELDEAHRALLSTLRKCEKMDAGRLGASQRTLLERRIAALKVALALIEKESGRLA